MLDLNKIESLRKKVPLSQDEFAKELGISRNTYSTLKRTGDFRISTLYKMSEIFGVDVITLFHGSENHGQNESIAKIKRDMTVLKSENEMLRKRINDLEKIVNLLEKK